MCGIFGLTVLNKSDVSSSTVVKSFETLFHLSESRGKEASGLAASFSSHTLVLKMPLKATRFLKTTEFKNLMQSLCTLRTKDFPLALIGHTRLATSGSQTNNYNNQPVVGKNTATVHNGIIVNNKSLWEKHPDLKQHYSVDTEIIIALYEKYRKKNLTPKQAIAQTYCDIVGEASVAILESTKPYLVLATNTGSLYYAHKNGSFVFASERYMLHRCVQSTFKGTGITARDIFRVEAGTGLIMNLVNLTIQQFHLSPTSDKRNPLYNKFHRPLKSIAIHKTFSTSSDMFLNAVAKLKTHTVNYEAIRGITRCSKCVLPITMPLITFDEQGICNFCRSYKKQQPLGIKALESYIAPYRSGTDDADCIVALSGGRDSSYGLHYVKKIFKLNPIAYTYDWGMVTDVGRRNQSRMVSALGVEHIVVSADIQKKRSNIKHNIEAWLRKPDPGLIPLFMAGDKQAEYYAEELRRKTKIKLVIYCRGNQIENEEFKWGYCGIKNGSPGGVLHNLSTRGKIRLAAYYMHRFAQNPSFLNSSLIDSVFAYFVAYMMPLHFTYLWHYIPWNENAILNTLTSLYGWESATNSEVTWRIDDGSVPFYNYIYYHLQGFTENDTLRSNQIREGVLSRNEALKLVFGENQPRYEDLSWYFDQLQMNGDRVLSHIDRLPRFY